MDEITVLIMSMRFFRCFIVWGFVIAFSYGNMKGDDEQEEDGVKKEPEDGSDADEVWKPPKLLLKSTTILLKPMVILIVMKLYMLACRSVVSFVHDIWREGGGGGNNASVSGRRGRRR